MSEEAALYGDDDAVAPAEDYEGAALYSDDTAAQSGQAQSDGAAANGEGESEDADALHYQTEDYTAPQQHNNINNKQSNPQQQQQQQQRSANNNNNQQLSQTNNATSPSSSSSHPPGINPLSVYVENLPVPLTEGDLRAHFSPYGSITTTKLNINMQTGEQLGYGFVEYGSEDEAKRAVDGVNGSLMRGRTLRARFATARGAKRERDPQAAPHVPRGPMGGNMGGQGMGGQGMGMGMGMGAGGGGGGGGGGFDKTVDNCNLYVAGLPWSWTQQDVEQCFSAFGGVTDCKLLINLQTKESKGVAFVKLDNEVNAQRAIATLNNKQMDGGTVLQVRVAHKNEKKPPGGGGMGRRRWYGYGRRHGRDGRCWVEDGRRDGWYGARRRWWEVGWVVG